MTDTGLGFEHQEMGALSEALSARNEGHGD
jgi:hypothetical protein